MKLEINTICWILNLIGIIIWFLTKFSNRKNSSKVTFSYWFSHNWSRLISTLLLNAAFMLILMLPDTQIDLTEVIAKYNIPFGLVLATKPTISLALGLGLTAFLYKKVKAKKK